MRQPVTDEASMRAKLAFDPTLLSIKQISGQRHDNAVVYLRQILITGDEEVKRMRSSVFIGIKFRFNARFAGLFHLKRMCSAEATPRGWSTNDYGTP